MHDVARVILSAIIVARRIDDGVPDLTVLCVGEREIDGLRSSVQKKQEIVVEDPASVRVGFADGIAVVEHHRRSRPRLVPLLFRHVSAGGGEPLNFTEL